ncbi:hypothetical protein [Patulibacter sp. SYSU D01012]|uniref:hypothetical protein n=1 Tax=Patulibacter sp. SYSU D01012 TaxID=2817381 RepID=UPI001B30713D|nr:hypothetical protein [Patulibacter sp. SYSU D01012]
MPETPTPDDPLDDLRARIAATQEAAERLHEQAAAARADDEAGRVPPNGWATPQDRQERADEVHALAALLRALRDLVPAELQSHVTDLVRQLLLLARAIIDWWVERLGLEDGRDARPPAGAGPRVEDIPIG